MDLYFISPGKTKDRHLAKLTDHYQQQIRHHANIEWIVAKEAANSSRIETQNIFQQLERVAKTTKGSPTIYALDERGSEFDSVAFSKDMVESWEKGNRPLIFLLGGAYGFDQEYLAQHINRIGQLKILALSKFTFTHELARLLILEQVYRALHIQRGTKYHH